MVSRSLFILIILVAISLLAAHGAVAAELPDSEPTPAQRLAEILSREEFQPRSNEQPFMEEVRQYFFRKWAEWRKSLRELLAGLPRPQFELPDHFQFFFDILLQAMRIVLYAAAFLLVALLLFLAYRLLMRGVRGGGRGAESEKDEPDHSRAELLAKLEPSLAGLQTLHAFVRREIRREGALPVGATDRECISKNVDSKWSTLFSDLSRLYERVIYGQRTLVEAEIRRLIAAARGLL